MYIDFTILDDVIFSLPETNVPRSELEKAKEIREQLSYSIEWLKFQASTQKDYDKKSTILKEITAAQNEYDRIDKAIRKAETE